MKKLFALKRDKKDIYFIFSIILISILFFFGIGQHGYIEMKDTPSYCLPNLTEGIMPVYPFLINICRVLFGKYCLDAVATIQGLLATVIITVFLLFLKKKFELEYWEVYLLWLAAVLPFAIELPRYVLTHVIYTEGITYSCFYVFVMFALNTLLEKEWKWFWFTVGTAIFMGLMRPQLMLLLILCSILLIYKLLSEKKRRVILNLIIGMFASILLIALGVIGIFKIRTIYINSVGVGFEQRFEVEGKIELEIEKEYAEADKRDIEKKQEENVSQGKPQANSLGQVGSALICRAFYEAESDDYQHYDDPNMQEMFLRIYHECDKQQILYPYAKEGLWMWEDLTQTDIYSVASREIGAYLTEKYPELGENELLQKITQIKISMAIKEIQLHFGRFIYHCFRLMIPGFISCIFFNIESIYLLCHIIVLFLYVSAIIMGAYIIKQKEMKNAAAKFILASVLSCIVFVGVVNSIFFGMQRYFIYNMGVFYCAYYLAFREICVGVFRKRGWNTALFELNKGN